MRPALIVKPNPVTDDSIGMLQSHKPLTMNILLFQSSGHTPHHPVLLGTVRCDELSSQDVASDQGCEASTGKDQAIVRSQKKRPLYFDQCSKPSNQGSLQSGLCRLSVARTRQVPAEKLLCVAVNHQNTSPSRLFPPILGKGPWPSAHPARPLPRVAPPLLV